MLFSLKKKIIRKFSTLPIQEVLRLLKDNMYMLQKGTDIVKVIQEG